MARGEPLFRQWELLRTLQSHRFGLSVTDLAGRLECNQRTVKRDLSVLQDIFPVTWETRGHGRKFWKLAEHFTESDRLELTVTEMLSLSISKQFLTPLAGTPYGDGIETALQKIRTLLPKEALGYFARLADRFVIKYVGHHDYSDQAREIRALNEACDGQAAVRIVYRSAGRGEEIASEFHPYGMLLYPALYFVGYMVAYGEIWKLKAARIRAVRPLRKRFTRPKGFSLAEHVSGDFGVFGPGKAARVTARFTGWAATNVRETQWHPTQKIVKDRPDQVTARFELANTIEFKRWILGFGRHAVVLRPKWLADEIAGELRASLASYRP